MKNTFFTVLLIGILILGFLPPTSAKTYDDANSHPVWSQIGPPGGTIDVVVSDPTNAAVFYAGTNTGVFKSIDSGYTWFEIGANDLPKDVTVLSLTIDPYHPNIIYAGFSGYYGPVIYKTINYGTTWRALHLDLTSGQGVPALIVDPVRDGYVYAGTTRGMYQSTDHGETWSFFGLDWKAISSLCFNITTHEHQTTHTPPDSTLYACVEWPTGAVYRYQEGTWTLCSTEFIHPEYFYPRKVVATGDLVIIGGSGWFGSEDADIYASTDQGDHWTPLYPVTRSSSKLFIPQAKDDTLRHVSIRDKNTPLERLPPPSDNVDIIITSIIYEPDRTDSNQGTVYIGVANGILSARTTDLTTWSDNSENLHGLFVSALAKTKDTFIAATGNYLFETFGDAGIFRRDCTVTSPTYDKSWKPVMGISNSYVYSVAASQTNPSNIVAGKDSGIYCSTKRTVPWDRSTYQNYCEDYDILGLQTSGIYTITFDPNDDNVVYCGSQTGFVDVGAVLKSYDGGLSWETLLLYGGRTNTIVVDPENSLNVYAGYSSSLGGVLLSRDGGTNWEINPLETPVFVLAIDPYDSQILYAGGVGVHVSYDSGVSWNLLGLPGEIIISLAIDPISQTIYAGTVNNGVYKSSDHGISWVLINNGLSTHLYITALLLIDNSLYAGTDDGGVFILKSTEYPLLWKSINLGLTNSHITDLTYGDALYAATYGSGVFQLKIH